MNYYSFHISDWVLHTSHLTLEEEGVYRRLLDYYYDTEKPIPTETQPVIRRLRLGSHAETVALILSEFFHLEGDGWHNNRADIEIENYHANAERARVNGKKGGRPKKQTQEECGQKTQPVILANPEKTESKANQEPRTNNQEPNNTTASAVVSSEPYDSEPEPSRAKNTKSLDYSGWPSLPSEKVFSDYKKLRQSKRAPITQTVVNQMASELKALERYGVTVDQALSIACERGWQGIKCDWILNHLNQGGGNAANQHGVIAGPGGRKVSHSDQTRADAREALERLNGSLGDPAVRSTG